MMTGAGRYWRRRSAAITGQFGQCITRRLGGLCIPAGLAATILLAGCDASPTWVLDGGPPPDSAPPRPDAGPLPDGTPALFADVSLAGCAEVSISAEVYHCVGPVALRVRFTALVPPEATSTVWDFGDGSAPSAVRSPDHVYGQPGTYPVTLVIGGPFGTISPSRLVQVTVTKAPLGAWCAQDGQCQSGDCLCQDGAPGCPAVLSGTCTADCADCADSGVCADLGVRDATDLPPWRDRHCLPGCETAGDCLRSGFGCQEVPTRDATGTRSWTKACLPQLLSEVGGSCTDAGGGLHPGECLSGGCLEVGRFGLCTDECALASCPSYAACAAFTGGPRAGAPLCLARCSAARPCTGDPDLACEAPDPAGELGFTVLAPGEPAGATYCAPRRCASPLDCPSGECDLAAGGFCSL